MISYIAVLVSIHKLYEIFIHKKTGAQTDESTENALNASNSTNTVKRSSWVTQNSKARSSRQLLASTACVNTVKNVHTLNLKPNSKQMSY